MTRPHTSNFARTAAWLAACGKEPGNALHASTQIGCHLEEVAELLECLRLDSEGGTLVIERITQDLVWLAGKVKSGAYIAHIPEYIRDVALDALCDAEVTGNGVAYLADFDKEGADAAVLASNDAKLVDGRPVLLEGGKIGKPEGWKAPDLSLYV